MEPKDLSELTDEELLDLAKKNQNSKLYDAIIIGLLIGIASYSAFENGFDFLTFIPFFYIPIASKNNLNSKLLKNEIKKRNLE
jgi:hypothetical protein